MLKAVISHNEQATIVELPMDRLSLQYELSQIGIRRLAKDIPIMDEEDQPISVKLYSESDIGQNLAMLFRPSHSLEDANVCAHAVVHARPEVQDEIEQSIVYGQYHSPQAVLADIKAMTTDLIAVTVNYYCPLQVRMTDEEYGDWYEVDNGYALDNKRAIRELLQKEQNEDMNDMADYFAGSESAKAKIVSAVWDVHEVNGELFGVIRTGLREILSPAEEQEWIDELIGQAADGFGEGLEQRPICTADGEIYGWLNSDTHEIEYGTNGMLDIGADAMYDNATEKGTIDTIPEIPGLAVWHEGHIGIYIGNGQVIHASGTKVGVVQTPIGSSGWTHWLKIPYITYIEETEEETP